MLNNAQINHVSIMLNQATTKEKPTNQWEKPVSSRYGAYNAYINVTTQYGALRSTTLYDDPILGYRDGYAS